MMVLCRSSLTSISRQFWCSSMWSMVGGDRHGGWWRVDFLRKMRFNSYVEAGMFSTLRKVTRKNSTLLDL